MAREAFFNKLVEQSGFFDVDPSIPDWVINLGLLIGFAAVIKLFLFPPPKRAETLTLQELKESEAALLTDAQLAVANATIEAARKTGVEGLFRGLGSSWSPSKEPPSTPIEKWERDINRTRWLLRANNTPSHPNRLGDKTYVVR